MSSARAGRPAIRAVIFDFDGVLADTERLHYGAFREVFNTRGWDLDETAYFNRYLGYDDRGLVVAYVEDRGLTLDGRATDAVVAEKTSAFSRHLSSGDVVFPAARACVAALAGDFKLGIASGALHHEIVSILRAAGLIDYFRVIVGADDVPRSKPWPDPYLKAADALGVAPAECLAIEDSPGGLASALAAGMRVVAITTTTSREALTGADHVIERLEEFSRDLIAAIAAQSGA